MSLMSSKNKPTVVNPEIQAAWAEAVRVYQEELVEYKKACSVYTKIRLLADHPNASDAELATFMREQKAHKAACKKFTAARTEFNHAATRFRAAQQAVTVPATIEFEGITFPRTGATLKEVLKLQKEQAFEKELTSGQHDELIEAALKLKAEREALVSSEAPILNKKTSEVILENLNKDDPFLGDFPLE